jgi:hypothetical protein
MGHIFETNFTKLKLKTRKFVYNESMSEDDNEDFEFSNSSNQEALGNHHSHDTYQFCQ